ncbi:MAG: NFACT RNA binding domain-containing protein [Candidatus ainarchaeum sp.]|nr:NFACT RNA binding domain-containing protein [Candidatus ainarchaeum sp.]
MKLTLFYDRPLHDSAAYYYELAKESRGKAAGLVKAIEETEKELGKAKKAKKKAARVKREKEWYGKFHFAFTSGGRLMLGGRNAQQNDLLFAKHMDDADLFFHADIQGASAVILKGGAELPAKAGEAGRQELAEAAQFAASFSKAWLNGNASVDVYAVRKGQVSKHAAGGFVPTGAFAISGERTWFRGTKLALRMGTGEKGLAIIPEVSPVKLQNPLVLVPSRAGKDKGALAKSLAKRYGAHPDELLEILPNGRTKTQVLG